MASNICSFNLKEVCEATISYIKNDNIDLMDYLKVWFSNRRELIFNEKELRSIYENRQGSFKVRARYKFDKKNSCIEIYEIPYTTTSEAVIDSTIDLVKNGKIKDITDIRDETGLIRLKLRWTLNVSWSG